MTLWLDSDGWDTASWELIDPPAGSIGVEFYDHTWYPLDVADRIGSILVCGADYDPQTEDAGPAREDCVVLNVDVLPRVKAGGITRSDEWIRIRNRSA